MQPAEIERLLLLSLKSPDDIATLKNKYGISLQNFPFMAEEAKFIYNFAEEFERMPHKDELTLEFPKLVYTDGADNLEYLANEFNKEVIRREIVVTASTYMEPDGVLEKDSRTGVATLIKRLEIIRDRYVYVDNSHRNAIDAEGALMRLERYRDIVTGERTVDTYGLGIEPLEGRIRCLPGNLIGLFADTGVGKSWVALKIASEFFRKKEKVVVVSPELSVEELNLRTDVILARRMGYDLSYRKLLYGERDVKLMENYEKYLIELGMLGNWVNYDSSDSDITVDTLEGIIVAEKPMFLIIDGIYLMSSEGYATWERVKNICNGLKVLATKHKLVILMINQSGRQAADAGRAARKEEVADGYYFTRASDILLSLGKVDEERTILELSVLKLRSEADITESFRISFDADRGDIGENVDGDFAPPFDVLDY